MSGTAGASPRPSASTCSRYVSGDVADHDHEIEEARWIPLERAARELTYAGEREMVQRALSRTAADR